MQLIHKAKGERDHFTASTFRLEPKKLLLVVLKNSTQKTKQRLLFCFVQLLDTVNVR